MMKIIKGNYGECRFCDNMDEEHGLPSLEDKSWDLCLTDPPYGQNIQHKDGVIGGSILGKVTFYPVTNDNIFTNKQHNAIKEISNNQIYWGGNYYDFLPITSCWLIWDKKKRNGWHNDFADGEMAWTSFNSPLKIFRFLWMGCMKESKEERTHPFQKPTELWNWIITMFKPTSVLDPFLGSGTTAQVCETLGIPWLGYEIMEEYAPDIEKRIKKGITEHSRYKPTTKTTQKPLLEGL